MSAGKVSIKGQVTLPVEMRKKHGIQANSQVVYLDTQDGILVCAAPDVFSYRGALKLKGKMSWEEQRSQAAKALTKHKLGRKG